MFAGRTLKSLYENARGAQVRGGLGTYSNNIIGKQTVILYIRRIIIV